jgi:peptide/nickel transport system substrate-binding protein
MAVVSSIAFSACSTSNGGAQKTTSTGFSACVKKPNDCNSGTTRPGGTLTYAIEKTINGWNVNDAHDSTFDLAEVLDGVLPPGPFITRPDFSVALNDDMMVSAEVTSSSPQTVVYKIKPGAVWDDGVPINADDFVYAWQTQNGKDCATCTAATNAGYDQMKSVVGSDSGKTVTVVYDTPFTDWQQPFGTLYPAHVAKQHGDLATSWAWLNENLPTYSGGPYKISDYQPKRSVTEVPNPRWYGKVKPSLDRLVFQIITDQSQESPALRNNEVQAIYPQPYQDLVTQVKGMAPDVQYNLGTGLSFEHIDANLKNKFLADKVLRQAIFTAISRKEIVSKTVGQFAPDIQPLNSHNFVPGVKGYQDVVTATGQGNGDLDKARKLLTDAGYTGVGTALKTPSGEAVAPLAMRYTVGNQLRQITTEVVQSQLAKLGITVTIKPTESLGDTLHNGDFDLVIFAWTGAPFPFAGALQLWLSTSESNFGHWVNARADQLIRNAATQTDRQKAIDDLNQADRMMTDDAYVLPLFAKPTFLAVSSKFVNVRDNATSIGPPYNVQEWGLRLSN